MDVYDAWVEHRRWTSLELVMTSYEEGVTSYEVAMSCSELVVMSEGQILWLWPSGRSRHGSPVLYTTQEAAYVLNSLLWNSVSSPSIICS